MKVAFFSPLPPARTGVADYAAALLGALRRRGRSRSRPRARRTSASITSATTSCIARSTRARLARPGVAVLHDAVLQHFFLGSLDERAYVEEFVYNYGEWRRGLAAEMWRGRAASGLGRRYFEYPMLRRIAEASRAVVVHNAEAARMVRAHHAARAGGRNPAPVRAARAAPGGGGAALPRAPRHPARRVRLRRLRLPARIEARDGACCAPSRGCGANAPAPRCWWPAISFPRTSRAPPLRTLPRPASCGCRTSASANSSSPPAPPIAASTCATPARARPPASPSA